MTKSISDIDDRLKEAQQKAIELQQQRERLRQEQIDKIKDESLKLEKAEAERINEEMTTKEREALNKYVEHLPRRLELFMNEQRAQHNGMTLTPEGGRPQPILTQIQEAQLLDTSIAQIELNKNKYIEAQTKDLQQELNAVNQKALEQQAELDRKQAERDKLTEQGLNKLAERSTQHAVDHYASLKTSGPTNDDLTSIIDGKKPVYQMSRDEYRDAEAKRTAALERIAEARRNGEGIQREDLTKLHREDLQTIRDKGDAAIQEMIDQQRRARAREEQREMERGQTRER